MWEWIKAAPWTWGIGITAFVIAVVGVIVAIVKKGFWKDHGMMKSEKTGKPLRWETGRLPIGVMYAVDVDLRWLTLWRQAVAYFQMAVSRRTLFMRLVEGPHVNADAWLPVGYLLIRQDVAQRNPTTEHRYDLETGIIGKARLTLPPWDDVHSALRMPALMHEVGHILGLAHDEHPESIMYYQLPLDRVPGKLSSADKALLNKWYA